MNNTTTIDNSTVPSLDNSTVTLNNDTNNIVPPVDNNTTSVDNNTISTMDNNSNSTIISDGNNTNSTFVSFDKSSVFSFEEALKLHQKYISIILYYFNYNIIYNHKLFILIYI